MWWTFHLILETNRKWKTSRTLFSQAISTLGLMILFFKMNQPSWRIRNKTWITTDTPLLEGIINLQISTMFQETTQLIRFIKVVLLITQRPTRPQPLIKIIVKLFKNLMTEVSRLYLQTLTKFTQITWLARHKAQNQLPLGLTKLQIRPFQERLKTQILLKSS